jgi:hypothetical protein
MIPGWLKSAWAVLAGTVMLLLRYFQKKDANEIPDAVNKARADAVQGNDDSLNADLDAARQRMQDRGSSNKP